MDKFIIRGGNQLEGNVKVEGSKNAALPILAASLMADDICHILNIPYIDDIVTMDELLRELGAKVTLPTKDSLIIDSRQITLKRPSEELVHKLRASYYFLGALLGKFGHAEVAFPGGDAIGIRPIDIHINGLKALGAEIKIEHGIVIAHADKLIGSEVDTETSVGATINIMLAAVKARGMTTIINAAREPHVVDTANFLNMMGARIKGAGTDKIRIYSVEKLHGCEYTTIPDQIVTGTYMMAVAATGGKVRIEGVIPKHMEALSVKLLEMGVMVVSHDDQITVTSEKRLRSTRVITKVYPGFATDFQALMSTILTAANGVSSVTETIFESRFRHLEQLSHMGAKVNIQDRIANITGMDRLSGAKVVATDIRAGASLVIAGLMAEGVTEITDVYHIDRGYMDIVEKLKNIGADIERVSDDVNNERIHLIK